MGGAGIDQPVSFLSPWGRPHKRRDAPAGTTTATLGGRAEQMAASRKLGRPPDTSSEETRLRILDAARRCFARHGYEGTTNRRLAEAAGLTTGAIYHYFGSKLELYIETHIRVQEFVYTRFEKAVVDAAPTFVDGIIAVLDEAVALNREDPTLATFLVAVRTDSARHAELGDDARLHPSRRIRFFGDLIDRGIETGELRAEDRQMTMDVLVAVLMGLVSASSNDPGTHARAVRGVEALITGSLIERPEA